MAQPLAITVIERDGTQFTASTVEYRSVDYRHQNEVYDSFHLAAASAKGRLPEHPDAVWAIWPTGVGGHHAMREALAVPRPS